MCTPRKIKCDGCLLQKLFRHRFLNCKLKKKEYDGAKYKLFWLGPCKTSSRPCIQRRLIRSVLVETLKFIQFIVKLELLRICLPKSKRRVIWYLFIAGIICLHRSAAEQTVYVIRNNNTLSTLFDPIHNSWDVDYFLIITQVPSARR